MICGIWLYLYFDLLVLADICFIYSKINIIRIFGRVWILECSPATSIGIIIESLLPAIQQACWPEL